MKKMILNFLSVVFINYVISSPVDVSIKTNIFQDFKNFSVKCPELSKSYLSDPASLYFEECVTFPKVPVLSGFNINEFFCAGVLDAEYKLCNTLGDKKFDLPKDFKTLNEKITLLSQTDVTEICHSLIKINETAEIQTKPYVDQLNKYLKNQTTCSSFCHGVVTKTNDFCSLISFIYDLIDKVKALGTTEKNTPDQNESDLKSITPKSSKSIDNKVISSTPTEMVKENLPITTNTQVKKADVSQKIPLTDERSTQIQTNPQVYPNTIIQNQNVNEPQQSQSAKSTSTAKTTTKSQIASVEQPVDQIDKNTKNNETPKEEVLPGIVEEDKTKDNPLNFDESKEDGQQNYADEDPDEDTRDDFYMKKEGSFKGEDN